VTHIYKLLHPAEW